MTLKDTAAEHRADVDRARAQAIGLIQQADPLTLYIVVREMAKLDPSWAARAETQQVLRSLARSAAIYTAAEDKDGPPN